MTLTASVTDPVREPIPADWDTFVTEQQLSAGWRSELLKVTAWCAQAASSLVCVRDDATAQPMALFHARHVGASRPWRFAQLGKMPPVSMAECRITPHLSSGVAFAASTDHRDRTEAVRIFERALRKRAGLGGRLIAYRAVPTEQLPALRRRGRVRLRQRPTMVLHNRWTDIDDYLASLPSKVRSQFKQIRRTVDADDSIQVELAETIEATEACWLVESVRRRHRAGLTPFPPWPAEYYRLFGQLPGSRFLTYRDSGRRLLAYLAVYDDGVDLMAGVWGYRDFADGGRRNLYFDHQLRMVEWMVNAGRRRLVLGEGMDALKLRLGAEPEPRWGIVGLR